MWPKCESITGGRSQIPDSPRREAELHLTAQIHGQQGEACDSICGVLVRSHHGPCDIVTHVLLGPCFINFWFIEGHWSKGYTVSQLSLAWFKKAKGMCFIWKVLWTNISVLRTTQKDRHHLWETYIWRMLWTFLVWPMSRPLTMRRQGLWPFLQAATRWRLRCFGFTAHLSPWNINMMIKMTIDHVHSRGMNVCVCVCEEFKSAVYCVTARGH